MTTFSCKLLNVPSVDVLHLSARSGVWGVGKMRPSDTGSRCRWAGGRLTGKIQKGLETETD